MSLKICLVIFKKIHFLEISLKYFMNTLPNAIDKF